MFIRKLIEQNIDCEESNVQYFQMVFKGKLGVTGNARKRRFKIKFRAPHSAIPMLTKRHNFLVQTQTGTFSAKGVIRYTR